MEHSSDYSNNLFLALTRPSLVMGVPMDAFFINIIIALCTLILTKNILYAGIWLPLHLTCVVLCRMDMQLFSIILAQTRLVKSNNNTLWKGCCYEPF